jgi:CRP-like cAMP-binding protein
MRRVDAAELRDICDATPELRTRLHRYLRSRMAEAMEAAACHLRHPLEKRLASWIATATELLGCEEISVTHAELARLLGVRRPTMTLALQAIEGAGAIRASRGRLIVRDRSGLRRLACRCLAAPRITLSQPVGSDSGGSA